MQGIANYVDKHAVAGSTRLAATTATGGLGIVDIKISEDLDNGTIIGKGELISGQVYAMADAGTFTGRILKEKAANGNFYVEVESAENAYLVLTVPVTYYNFTTAMGAESTFYNANGDVVRAYHLVKGDVFELSAEGFSGTPAVDTEVSLDAATRQVKVGA